MKNRKKGYMWAVALSHSEIIGGTVLCPYSNASFDLLALTQATHADPSGSAD
jgi:hypothetical protein